MIVILKTIIAKLEMLVKEEAAKTAVEKEMASLERAYFRSMYKGLPKTDVDILDCACQGLRSRANHTRLVP